MRISAHKCALVGHETCQNMSPRRMSHNIHVATPPPQLDRHEWIGTPSLVVVYDMSKRSWVVWMISFYLFWTCGVDIFPQRGVALGVLCGVVRGLDTPSPGQNLSAVSHGMLSDDKNHPPSPHHHPPTTHHHLPTPTINDK